jgi:hypothetical protein
MTSYRYGGIGIAAAIAMVVALGACGGGGDKQQTAEEQLDDAFDQLSEDLDEPVETTVEEEEAEAPPEPVEVDLDLPREAVYAQATWSVMKVSYQGPGVDELGEELAPQAIVEFSVANTGEGGTDQDVSYELLSLLDGDGGVIAGDYDTLEEDIVVFGGQGAFEATFPLDEGATEEDLADYTFQVGEDGKVPAPIPFSGTLAEAAYPITLTGMPTSVPGEVIGGPSTATNIRGTISLDYAGQRADEGTRFVTLSIDIVGGTGSQHLIGQGDVRLSVEGIEMERANPPGEWPHTNIPEGAMGSGTWVFVTPDTGKNAAVHFGGHSSPDNPPGPFTLPDLP